MKKLLSKVTQNDRDDITALKKAVLRLRIEAKESINISLTSVPLLAVCMEYVISLYYPLVFDEVNDAIK